jgi:hypothetical protein
VELAGPGGSETLPCTGLFSFIGANPASGWLSGCAALDDHGFVLTDRALRAEHLDGRWDARGRQTARCHMKGRVEDTVNTWARTAQATSSRPT